MPNDRQAAIAESWRKTLAGIESPLGRLAYLASLRNENKGTYEHFGLAERIGEEEAHNVIRRSHLAVFQEWLCFGLERQKEELEAYFASLDGDREKILANWLVLGPYASWIPAESRDVERKLFYTDLETVLELIRTEYGVASRDPDV
ncbi:MAG TPA: hypothetical protein VHC72_11665 [Bryobacteraceae bacterium]|jgi:hypothetical protein|nr:hypothetical protein [Bryobacteraceae bacterium]